MSAELAVQEPTFVTYQDDPTGGRIVAWAQAASAANLLAQALTKTTFVPADMKEVGNATAAILMGDELGLSPLAAMRSIYVVHGTPALYTRAMVALALSRGHEIWTESSAPEKVVVCGKRKGSEHTERSEWTIARARTAGYTSNKKYETDGQGMLYAKAAGEIVRKIAADVIAGIPYSVEDLELEEVSTVTVQREPRKISRAPKPEPLEPSLDNEPDTQVDTPEPSSVQNVVQESEPEFDEPEPTEPVNMITPAQIKKMTATMGDLGLTHRASALNYVNSTIGRIVESRNELTRAEAAKVIHALEADLVARDGVGE